MNDKTFSACRHQACNNSQRVAACAAMRVQQVRNKTNLADRPRKMGSKAVHSQTPNKCWSRCRQQHPILFGPSVDQPADTSPTHWPPPSSWPTCPTHSNKPHCVYTNPTCAHTPWQRALLKHQEPSPLPLPGQHPLLPHTQHPTQHVHTLCLSTHTHTPWQCALLKHQDLVDIPVTVGSSLLARLVND